jgi:hypothetical protein
MPNFTSLRFGVIVASFVVAAAPDAQADDTQAWSSLVVQPTPAEGEKLLLSFDAHARWRDDASELGVTILRPALGWRLNPSVDLWAGYAHVMLDTGSADITEHRLWQQVTFKAGEVFGGQLSSRTRLEQRERENADGTGYRLRQLVRWSRPIDDTPLSIVATNEVFAAFNDTDWGQRSGFDQNRAFIGLGVRLSGTARLEAGYLNNLIDTPAGTTTNQAVAISFVITP